MSEVEGLRAALKRIVAERPAERPNPDHVSDWSGLGADEVRWEHAEIAAAALGEGNA